MVLSFSSKFFILMGYYFLSYFFYIFSFFGLCSMSNPLGMWFFLELNLIAFLGIVKFFSSEAMKYFIIQALGSIVFILSILFFNSGWLLLGGIILKLGLFPFHSWFISMSNNLTGWQFFVLAGPQKFPGLFIMQYFSPQEPLIVFWLGGVVIGAIGIYMSNSLIPLFSYSSIFNMSLLLSMILVPQTFWFFFILYIFSLFFLFFGSGFLSGSKLSFSHNSSFLRLVNFVLFLNFIGMPPFFNMWGKLSMLNFFLEEMYMLSFLFLFLSYPLLLSAYLRILNTSMTWGGVMGKVFEPFLNKLTLFLMLFLSLFMLIL